MSSPHVGDELWDLVQQTLFGAERARVDAHLAGCSRCADEHRELFELIASLGWSEPVLPPPPALRSRLLAEIARPWYATVLERFATLLDLPIAAARSLLDSLAGSSAWEHGPLPGLQVATVPAGAARAGAYAGLLRMTANAHFPAHTHLGDEHMLVLSGGFRDSDGRLFHAGDSLTSAAGTTHDFVVLSDGECLTAVVQYGGIDFNRQ
jgi:hypothetical protein